MLWQKRIKAGVMLYALLMMAVFALLLQFYLNRQVAAARNHQASRESLNAYAMAVWTRDRVKAEEAKKAQHAAETVRQDSNQVLKKTEASESSALSEQESGQLSAAEQTAQKNEEQNGQAVSAAPNPKTETVPSEAVRSSPSENQSALAGRKISGRLSFKEGTADYHLNGSKLTVDLVLTGGGKFQYRFALDKQASKSN